MFLLHALLEEDYEYQTYVQNPETLILTVLAGIADKYGKFYCYPSQDKILALLARYGRRMSRRTLNRHLNQLERLGYIKRQCRHTHDSARGWIFRSTIYQLTRRTLKWLAGMLGAAKRAFDFLKVSRVPNSFHNSLPKRIIPVAHPKSGCAPPGSLEKGTADEAGGPTNKEKTVGFTELGKIRTILHA